MVYPDATCDEQPGAPTPLKGGLNRGGPLIARFSHIAQAHAQRVALTVDGAACTYEQLAGGVSACALVLAEHGCGVGDAIASIGQGALDFTTTALATWAIGGIFVPLNPRFREEELSHYLEMSRPKVVCRSTGLEQALWEKVPSATYTDPELPSGLYMFSSGSTGKSKRVTRTQEAILAEYRALADTIELRSSDRILCTLPLFHAHGMGNALLAALLTGATVVLPSAEFNARATARLLGSERISIYPAVPFMFKMLAETRFAERPELSHLRLAFSAGAALPEEVSQRFFEVFGKPVSQLYGSTETGAITINRELPRAKPTSVGLPLTGLRIEIRDEQGAALSSPEVGEVWVKSPAATHAYDGLAELTAEAFVDGYFVTGDLGYLDADGDLYITGRKKLLINVAGFKVDPLEVEEVLRAHPEVSEVVVVGAPHPEYGERVKAVVVWRSETPGQESELRALASNRLAEYKRPQLYDFVEDIPRSPLGKVLRKYL